MLMNTREGINKMNQTVKRIVDILFQETVENDETKALHEELMNNCQEHYQDLISRGLSEDEAVAEVVESLKGMKDVIAQYPKKTAGPASFSDNEEAEEGKRFVFTAARPRTGPCISGAMTLKA